MKKIRFSDNTELEIYNISCSGNTLTVEVLNGKSTDLETLFKDSDNLAVIQYYVGTELVKGYAGYTQLQEYKKRIDEGKDSKITVFRETYRGVVLELESCSRTMNSEVQYAVYRCLRGSVEIESAG